MSEKNVHISDLVTCPSCRGRHYNCTLCAGHIKLQKTAAILWCEMMQLADDVTQREKKRIRNYAQMQLGVTIDPPAAAQRKSEQFLKDIHELS